MEIKKQKFFKRWVIIFLVVKKINYDEKVYSDHMHFFYIFEIAVAIIKIFT